MVTSARLGLGPMVPLRFSTDALGYRALSQLSRSLRAEVLLAERVGDGARVVLKRHLDPEGATAAVATAREREALARIRSTSIVSLAGGEPHGPRPEWIALAPLLDHETLASRLARARPDPARQLPIARELTRALAAVHAAHVVHRGLCPDNVLLAPDLEHVVLAGFGGASVERAGPEAGSSGIRTAPIGYIAPEILVGFEREVDYRADYFALGAVLYELFTGVAPFAEGSTATSAHRFHSQLVRTPEAPRVIAPDLPERLSQLVMQLLAKSPDDRPQSSDVILAELSGSEGGTVVSPSRVRATPRAVDRGERLRPGGFFGRDKERRLILAALSRVAAGQRGLVTIDGLSGIGKSALVAAVEPELRAQGARVARGKFDQLRRSRPYGAISDALRGLAAEILAEAGDRHGELLLELRSRLGEDAPWLLRAIPEAKSVLEVSGPSPRASVAETQARITHALARWVGALANLTGPIVLFLDDVQWADQATVEALPVIATETNGRVLVVLAFRSNEVGAADPVLLAVDELTRRGLRVDRVHLGPLGLDETTALVAQAVGGAPGHSELARVVERRTEGNPLLATQFLAALGREGLIVRDPGSREWCWSLDDVRAFVSSEGVADVIARQLTRLPEDTRGLLALASLLGPSFEIEDLARVQGLRVPEVESVLAAAVTEGFVVALGGGRYRFLHDRIEQAAREPVEARAEEAHAHIARRLYSPGLLSDPAGPDPDGRRDRLPRLHLIAAHVRAGAGRFEPGPEARAMLELVSAAAENAYASAAHQTAGECLEAALRLLPLAGVEPREPRALQLYLALAECHLALGQGAPLERGLVMILGATSDPLTRARALGIRVRHAARGHRHDEAIDVALQGLALLGVRLDRRPPKLRVLAALLVTHWRLGRRTEEEIEGLPELEDETARIALELIAVVMASAYQVADQGLFALCSCAALELVLEHGHTPATAFDLCTYGMLRVAAFQDHLGGQKYSDLGLRIAAKRGDGPTICRSIVVHHLFIHHWRRHWRTGRAAMMRAHAVGRQAGEMTYAGYAFGHVLNEFSMGTPLDEASEVASAGESFTSLTGDVGASTFTGHLIRLYGTLRGTEEDRARATEMERADYERLERSWRYWWHGHRIIVATLLEDDALAAASVEGTLGLGDAGACSWHRAVSPAYMVVLYARRLPALRGAERRTATRRVRGALSWLRRWEASCPENATPYRALAEGAWAHALGSAERAMELLLLAMESAGAGEHRPPLILAARIAAEVAESDGRPLVARHFAALAASVAEEWQAPALAARLRARFGLDAPSPARPPAGEGGWKQDRVGTDGLVLALQAVSKELTLERLVSKLLEVVILTAGATSGYLLRRRDGGWCSLASARLGPGGREVVVDRTGFDPPLSLLRYAEHSGAPIVLDDALADGTFARDPHVLSSRPRSLLLLPIVRSEEVVAAVLLENELVRGAFMAEKVELLGLLSGQLAISLENAELYGRMERAVETANAAARAKAIFLANVSHELRTPLNAIHGTVDLLGKIELPREQRELVTILGDGSQALLRSVGALLDHTELEAGDIRLEDVGFDLARVVEACAARHRSGAREKSLAMETAVCGALDLGGDSVRLGRMLDHLLDNAVKFTQRGTISVTASVRDEDGRARVEVVVEDSGPGMSSEALGAAFHAFDGLHTRVAGAPGGFGVGLAYVRRSAELMGGSFTLDSRTGRGTRAVLSLPFRSLSRQVAAGQLPAGPAEGAPRSVVLAAEDNRVNQLVLARILEKLGHPLILCANGLEVVERYVAEHARVKVILMDCQMPELDGFEASLRIRALERAAGLRAAPIVAVTANVLSYDRDKCIYAGMDDYLPKPIRAGVLEAAISRWCGDEEGPEAAEPTPRPG